MSERDEFEAAYVAHVNAQNISNTVEEIAAMRYGDSYNVGGIGMHGGYLNGCWDGWKLARATQAVPALTEPVAWHIGNPDGTMNKLGAIYHHRQSAVDHFDSYGGDFNASIVPLYAASQPSKEPEKAPQRYQD